MRNTIVFIILIVFSLQSCKNKEVKQESSVAEVELVDNVIDFVPEDYKKEDIVFYNLFSPVDLTYLVTKDMSFYNSSLLNPLNNITHYNESNKAALNLGVYGADLSYLWLFDQSQQAHSYLTAIQQLSDQLAIPREFVNFTYADAQNHSDNLDTLVHLARESYYTAENYLKKTERDYAASLILLGGWIETMYIAINMYENPNPNVISRIAAQKFSSASLYKLLQMADKGVNIEEYLLLVKRINALYEEINVQYPEGSLVIDTFKNRIMVVEGVNIELSSTEIEEIRELVTQIRMYIVE